MTAAAVSLDQKLIGRAPRRHMPESPGLLSQSRLILIPPVFPEGNIIRFPLTNCRLIKHRVGDRVFGAVGPRSWRWFVFTDRDIVREAGEPTYGHRSEGTILIAKQLGQVRQTSLRMHSGEGPRHANSHICANH